MGWTFWQAKNRAAQRLVYIPRFENHTGMLLCPDPVAFSIAPLLRVCLSLFAYNSKIRERLNLVLNIFVRTMTAMPFWGAKCAVTEEQLFPVWSSDLVKYCIHLVACRKNFHTQPCIQLLFDHCTCLLQVRLILDGETFDNDAGVFTGWMPNTEGT